MTTPSPISAGPAPSRSGDGTGGSAAGQGWADEALGWLSDALARHGRRVTGPVEPRVRPWSVVWRVPTDAGSYWFKANLADTAYEAGLAGALARLVPGRVLDPVAVDAERGWVLLPDGGRTLREVLDGDRDLRRWEEVLPAYAELQLATAARVTDLLALGVPDHRPDRLPALLAELLDDRAALRVGAADGLTPQVYDRLRALLPEFTDWCRRLTGLGVAATLQHDDLHDGNVFAAADGYRFFDWGDSSVGHPFGTLLVTLRSVAHGFDLAPDDPALGRLRDAYLQAWTDRHDRATLHEAVGLAVTVDKLGRSLSWRRALATADPSRAGYAEAVPGWLATLLEPDRPH